MLPNHTYDYTSEVSLTFNDIPANFTYEFSLICNAYDDKGYNMTFVMKNMRSGDNKTFVDYTQQIKNLTRDIENIK